MSRNVYTGIWLAAAIGVAAPAVAQTHNGAAKRPRAKTVTAIGCLEAGTTANSFVLNVLEDGTGVPAGSRVSLTTPDQSEAQAHLGQKVQVLGTILGGPRSGGVPVTPSQMYVRDIRQVAPYCAAGAPAGTTSVGSTTALSGKLAQTGVSGNATLTTSPGWTMATPANPVNSAASPVTAPPVAASSPSLTAATPSNTHVPTETMAAPTMKAPTTTAALPVTAVPAPVPVTRDTAVSQQLTNTSTMIGTLDQAGITGNALLGGLLGVNVQQVMAAVQAQANVPVQADVIVNVSDIANDLQVQALVQALNTNPQASMNANDLTSALQSAGLIDPNQFVVGVTGSEIYSNTDLTTKLQQRGIISPSETIMSMLPGRIYVAQP
jgi:hypothetical protein